MSARDLRVNAIRDRLQEWFPEADVVQVRVRGDQKFRVDDRGVLYVLVASKELINHLNPAEMTKQLDAWKVAERLRLDRTLTLTRTGPQAR